MTTPKPPGPAGTVCALCGHYPNVFGCKPGDCRDPERATPVSAPVILSRPEVGATPFAGVGPTGPSSVEAFARASTPADAIASIRDQQHPPPWRWVDVNDAPVLRDANGVDLAWPDDYNGIVFRWPRVKAQTEAAPQLYSGVVALLGIIHEAVSDGWRPKSDDVGPVCANLRAFLARIDERSRS